MSLPYLFDQIIDRSHTNSYKWDNVSYVGKDMLPMPVADMDFPVANEIKACIDRISEHQILGYSVVPESLKIVAQQKINNSYGWDTPLDWQVWIPGIVPGITAACAQFADGGILTAVPVYHPFHLVANWVNKRLFTFPMVEENERWTFDFFAFEEALKKGPKVFLFCNPHNPGGTVFNEEEIQRIIALCSQYNCMIISDEIHADLRIQAKSEHICIGKYLESRPSISFFASSKTYNTAGLGGAVAIIPDPEIRKQFVSATLGFFPMLTRHSIEVMETSWTMPSTWLDLLLPYLKANHDVLLTFIRQQKGLRMLPLEATYLAWIEFDEAMYGNFQQRLFENGLHVLRGDQFLGSNFIRLNFACPRPLLEKALGIIQQTIHAIR
jgi:cystathionine beta-lyase